MSKFKMLFFAANPQDEHHLMLDREIREIKQKIRLADNRDMFELISEWAVQPGDLQQCLSQHKPHIVHFSSHGTAAGEIVLVDHSGKAQPVNPAALKALFSILKDNIQLVV